MNWWTFIAGAMSLGILIALVGMVSSWVDNANSERRQGRAREIRYQIMMHEQGYHKKEYHRRMRAAGNRAGKTRSGYREITGGEL